ncbi:hypothetical protein [Clostridium akagii]|uniref:hypothetical protein n=1 Tax=Clostridium akagii TaxID=91623 RepID=UPI00047D08D0|nr:hypothetical protein [Clostridium akagii]
MEDNVHKTIYETYIDKINEHIEDKEIYESAIYQCNALEKTMSLSQQLLFLELEKSVETIKNIQLEHIYKIGFEDGKNAK